MKRNIAVATVLLSAILTTTAATKGQGSRLFLEGQSRGGASWITGNLRNWTDLDDVPMRVRVKQGPVVAQRVTLVAPRYRHGFPAIEELREFTLSPNANFVVAPSVISAPDATNAIYSFTISVTNDEEAWVECRARLAAGAHQIPGSSLKVSGSPRLGALQIHKTDLPGSEPDLALEKTGPAVACTGEILSYALHYSNLAATSPNVATGVQITDTLPAGMVFESADVMPAISGNTLVWDLANVAPGTSGTLNYQVRVAGDTAVGSSLTNTAVIVTTDVDANQANNTAMVVTTVTSNAIPNVIGDRYQTAEDTLLSVSAPGVLANDSDANGHNLTATLIDPPANGEVVLETDGSFSYLPDADYFGTDTFTYSAVDELGVSSMSTVQIQVLPVNDAPGFIGGGNHAASRYSTGRTVPGWAREIRAGAANELQNLEFIVTNDNPDLFAEEPTITPQGTLAYKPAGIIGKANISVMLKDDGGDNDSSASYQFKIIIATPPVLAIKRSANDTVIVEFHADPGLEFYIEHSEDFSQWTREPQPILGTGELVQWPDTAAQAHRYYRAVLVP